IKLLLAVCLLAVASWAQSTRGTIVGNVTDASGAAVPAAEVVVTNQGTNVSVTTFTGNEGEYTVTNLDPGTYRVSVNAKGFKASTIEQIILQVSQTVRQNVQVTVGDLASAVTVEATAPVVQSDTSSLASVVDNRQIETIRLNGRANIFNLLYLDTR